MKKRLFVKIIILVLFIIIFIGALFVSSKSYIDHDLTPKWLSAALFIIILSIVITSNRLINKEKFCITKPDIALVAFIVFIVVHSLFLNVFNCENIFWIIIILLAYYNFRNLSQYNNRQLYAIIVGLNLVLAIQGLIQFINGKEIVGNFDNPAGFSASLVLALPSLFYFLDNKNKVIKLISVLIYCFIAFTIILANSRAGIIAMIILSFIYISIIINYRSLRQKSIFFSGSILLFICLSGFLYNMKKDSADGRLLIWSCSIDLVRQHPLFGSGQGRFKANYMLSQATYFKINENSKYEILADNVKHPFNEILLFGIEYGLLGIIILLVVLGTFVRSIFMNRNQHSVIALFNVVAIIIISLFSYPLQYPFVWLIVCYSLAVLSSKERTYTIKFTRSLCVGLLMISLLSFSYLSKYNHLEIKWNSVARASFRGDLKKMIHVYDNLYHMMPNNPFFLYNYAYQLRIIEEYQKSILILKETEELFNDSDIQMLIGINYLSLENWEEARDRFILAGNMCPNRFIPLYNLLTVYENMHAHKKLIETAEEICQKPVKVPSQTIDMIIRTAKSILKEYEHSGDNP